MAQKVVQVGEYLRKRKKVSGYERLQDIDRGVFGKRRAFPRVQHTIAIRGVSGRFTGRKRVEGSGDTTGVIKELSKMRILGRSKAFKS